MLGRKRRSYVREVPWAVTSGIPALHGLFTILLRFASRSLDVSFTIKDILYLNTMNNANMRILTVMYYDYIYKQNT